MLMPCPHCNRYTDPDLPCGKCNRTRPVRRPRNVINNEATSNPVEGVPVIFSYTRLQAIKDGVLVDLMRAETVDAVREAGIRYPVAMTATAFSRAVWPIDDETTALWLEYRGQDLQARLWDVLWMLRAAINRGRNSDTTLFDLTVLDAETKRSHRMMLKAVCGPGDEGEPVLTVMLPDED